MSFSLFTSVDFAVLTSDTFSPNLVLTESAVVVPASSTLSPNLLPIDWLVRSKLPFSGCSFVVAASVDFTESEF